VAIPVTHTKINLRYVIFLATTAALGGLLFGFDIAIITGAGPFLTRHFKLDDLSLGWAFSSLLFGCILGSLAAGRYTDRCGRRKILLWVATLFAVTSVATAVAPTFAMFIVARFLGGIAVGGASILSPMYVSEVSPANIRGRLGALYQMSIVNGILISYGINFALRNTGPANWRWMFLTGVIPSAVFFAMLLFAPETPRYLMRVGREREAFAILQRIGGTETAAQEVSEIKATLGTGKHDWRELFQPGIRRAVAVGFVLAILVQVSGINTVIDYTPKILESAGLSIDNALFSTIIIGLTNFVFTLLSFAMIDRYGRKLLYVIGSLGMTGSLVLLIATVVTGHFHGLLVLALIIAYLAFFASCIGPVFWTLVPEIFPNRIRGTAMTVPVLTQWVANAVVVLFFPLAFNHIGKAVTFGFLAVMALTQAIFAWFFVPETKNKSLEEIEAFWKIGTLPTAPMVIEDAVPVK
jgi:SP family arabinose:H+ symporter-like MFS transporter